MNPAPALRGRVAVVTGAGRGLGRQHALLLAREGARVVVNDLGCAPDGTGRDPSVAEQVAAQIRAAGGEAVAHCADVADWEGGRSAISTALESFGALHVLVNNAGTIRDRALVNLTEDDFDAVVRAHLKGHFVPTRWAAAYWREQHAAGGEPKAMVVNTSSASGLFGNAGQSNYAAAKAGITALTLVAADELSRYGVRCNAVTPLARTRLTESVPRLREGMGPPDAASSFDEWDPANISPVVAWLASEACTLTGQVLAVKGGTVEVLGPWSATASLSKAGRWTVAELAAEMPRLTRAATTR